MSYTFRPAKRERTPLVIGVAGPTKSGKTYSAHRIAQGLAGGGPVAMLNAEGAKGHQYADEFDYLACDIEAPFRPERYTEALKAALAINPAVVIVDSVSHMHNGPGGMLEYHEDEKKRLGGGDRNNFTAWVKPKAAETEFIYTLLGANCHIILCFRAKEKIKIVKGAEPIDLGWQPIASESIPFETIFTLMLPPNSKGVPDLAISQMRKPFDSLVPAGKPLDEDTGRLLAEWSAGAPIAELPAAPDTAELVDKLLAFADENGNRDVVEAHIGQNREHYRSDPAKHVAWLTGQIAKAEAKRVAA